MAKKSMKNWDDVNDALLRIGQLDIAQRELKSMHEAEIAKIKEEYEATVQPLIAERAELELAVGAYCESHKDDVCVGGVRSKKLFWGVIGWIASTKLVPKGKRTWAQILDSLWDSGKRQYIRIKKDVDKEALARLGEKDIDKLLELGLDLKPIDNFYQKPDMAAIADYKPAFMRQ